MRVVSFGVSVLAVVVFFTSTIHAQGQASQVPTYQNQMIHRQDGGVDQVLQSIVIPPKAGAPFTLTLQTEWVQTLSDGGTITSMNERRIARDGKGRIYQERWLLAPKTKRELSRMSMIQISDPSRHMTYDCMMDGRKVCEEMPYSITSSTVVNPMGPPPGVLPNGIGTANREGLGQNSIEGVQTVGVRESITYNVGVLGNDNPMTVEREYWFSAQLGINLLSRRNDPRFGTQTFKVTSITLGEPDPQLFELPKGFAPVHLAQAEPR